MNRLIIGFIVVAMLGWVASAILTAVHFWAIPLIPADANLPGSMKVITSQWAYIGPIPLATVGAVYYIVMIAMGALWLQTKNETIERLLLPVTGFGFLASLGFVYLQIGVIGAICPFCMMSAAATTVLFGIELYIKYRGGAASTPSLESTKVWPAVFATTMLLTIFAMWTLTVLPLPGSGA
ncbi:vitamin K epoxide reductase family protein [Natronogracilivirga saccharolytica]|uniref:Vitamin K epoxide reductase family protein n=1 Tax=Natronogracilivirga saccharolytica TaxID=2812953 RepID=A0A8J7RPW5_9BACT|nr:vitamin K epoxide reductase family protein [Natronogracilivirga saccharolytica]MBP3193744.1 vitamin K epoxide reductase family protein [Natronogracilivirga saccharolytica]